MPRQDLLAITHAAADAASASAAVRRTLERETLDPERVRVVAVGKAAAVMMAAAADALGPFVHRAVAIGTHGASVVPAGADWIQGGHPLPDAHSVEAGRHVRRIASETAPDEHLIVLLSGGASALLALPAEGLTLDDKRDTIRRMMHAGADIHALNTVRKHLSALKGGQLAAACPGRITTWAVSDVLDDDLSVIGSGPGVGDASTWADAAAALAQFGGDDHRAVVRTRIAAGLRGDLPDTPAPGDPSLARADARVIASRRDALAGARRAAEAAGYQTLVLDRPVSGEARESALVWFERIMAELHGRTGRWAVISAGETTVRVVGDGRGGRNQEFALALAEPVARAGVPLWLASVGTDGIDGPTDAAGAYLDAETLARAAAAGLPSPAAVLARNDAYTFFAALGDLIQTGPTDTNVGDLQVLLTVRTPHD